MHTVISSAFFPKIGGAHLWLYEVYRRWPCKVTLITSDYATCPHYTRTQQAFDSLQHGSLDIVREHFPLHDNTLFEWRHLQHYAAVIRRINTLARNSFSYIHCCRAVPEGLIGLLVKRLHPRSSKLVTYAHGEEILVAQSSRQLKIMAYLTYRASDLIIANSEHTKRLVKSICPRANVRCIHPGVDAAAFAEAKAGRAALRAKSGWPTHTLVVSTIARMEPRKNHAMVIRALAELHKEGLSIDYVCGGDGEENNRLVALARDLGLSERVRFTGKISDEEKITIYMASDIYAMPSIRCGAMIEGFGIVFLEAAAAGIPSIAGNCGGQSEAVLHGVTGLVVDGTSLQQVTTAIRTLAMDESRREVMGREAIKWALEHDWSNVSRQTFAEVSALRF